MKRLALLCAVALCGCAPRTQYVYLTPEQAAAREQERRETNMLLFQSRLPDNFGAPAYAPAPAAPAVNQWDMSQYKLQKVPQVTCIRSAGQVQCIGN